MTGVRRILAPTPATMSLAFVVLVVLMLATTAGCLPAERPACSPVQLAAIESAYVAEMLEACDGYTLETCPAAPEIEGRFAVQREEWISCR